MGFSRQDYWNRLLFPLPGIFPTQGWNPHLLHRPALANEPLKVACNCVEKHKDFPGGSDGKASVYNVGDGGSIPGSGRSSGEENGNPLQYSHLENPMDRGA